MCKSLLNAFKVKELRKKLLFVFLMLVVIRFGSNLPIPGVNAQYFSELFNSMSNNDAFGWFNTMTGGSFEQLSIFALSITPYITSSIIIQLLTVAIPALEEMQKDGEEGRKMHTESTRYLTSRLPLGNGISLVLLFNILSSVPSDFQTLYIRFISGKNVATMVVAAIIIVAAIIGLVVFTIILNDAQRTIPVQYSRRVQGRGLVGGQSSNIPLKVNTASVMPVIFASSLMTMPVVVGQIIKVDYSTIPGQILMALNSGSWCNPDRPIYSIGLVIYILLLYFFAYFYTSISFNPLEIANNMKKQGGFIPGIRPGKPTSDYLDNILTYIIFIGATGLAIVAIIPIFISGVFNVGRISFAGTSLIIIVGVVLETVKAIESQMVVRNYQGFLND